MPTQSIFISQLSAESTRDKYTVTMLVGDGTYHGIFYPRAEVTGAARSMKGRPVTVNHSVDLQDVVGTVLDAWPEGGNLKGVIQLNANAPKYAIAKGHIEATLAAKAVPNVSVDVARKVVPEQVNGSTRLTARGLDFVALALVARGECSDKKGCGVQLSAKGGLLLENETPAGSTPAEGAAAAVEKASLCAMKDQLSAVTAERDAALTALAAKNDEVVKLAAERDALKDEKERFPLLAALSAVAPGFDASKVPTAALPGIVEVAKLAAEKAKAAPAPAPADAGRRALLAAVPAKPEEPAYAPALAELKKHLGL